MTRYHRKKQQQVQLRNLVIILLLLAVLGLGAVILLAYNKGEPVKPLPSLGSPVEIVGQPSQSDAGSSAQSDSSSVQSQSIPDSTASAGSSAGSQSASGSSARVEDPYYEAELPMLVNPTNQIPEGYEPVLADIGNGYKLQERAAVAFLAMMQKASADGVSFWTVSAYRSHERQTTNFNNKIKEYEGNGYTAEQAYAATAQLIAVPGTSEHSLGYAVDLNSLYTSFEDTAQFRWLMQNCAEFGFVLRYPKDKVEITSISYEPWHYRYVGSNHARIIMENSICLEEYLSGDYE